MPGEQQKASESPMSQRQFQEAFPDFSEKEINRLSGYLEIRHFPQGAVVWEQGDPMEFLGFLVSGSLVVKRQGRFPGRHIILAMLEKGSLFGEMAIASSLRHSVTIAAVEDTRAYVLSSADAQQLLHEEPDLSIKLLKKIVVVSGLRLQHTGARLAELL